MKLHYTYWLVIWLLLSGFNFPNEKKYLSQQAANIDVFDADGNLFTLYSLLQQKPLIISPVYTKCYSLCGVISNGVQNAVSGLGTLGTDFNMVSFSFDSTDAKEGSPKLSAKMEYGWQALEKHLCLLRKHKSINGIGRLSI